ncbi:MAG TPA: Ppx/GppA phosphatase family protein [Actinomycetota bacterium]|nr:Ppx/GppA phosphatase family protein [Actinomycetota bacterium]
MNAVLDPAPDDRPFAVIDIGSNSGRMIVFRLRQGEHLDVLEDARAPLRLARELKGSRELGSDAIERTLEALRDFVAIARGAGASQMIAVATSAVREATDGHELIDRAQRLGVPLQTIDGDQEAGLGFFGAVHDLPVTSGLTFDVGGGSAEVSSFQDRRLVRSWSMPLGSLRVSDAFLTSDPPHEDELHDLRKSVKAALAEAGITELGRNEHLVGIGGTVRNLAKVDLRRTDHPLPLLHGYRITQRQLTALIEDLAARTMKRRARVPGLNPDRADTIVGGALVIQGIAKHVGATEIVVSSRGLREGLALATSGAAAPSPTWVRSISVATLAARFRTWNAPAAERRTSLAAELLAELDPTAPGRLREMLAHAATLLDIGRAIDYYDRFQHAANIVVAADLAGFSHADLGVLTAILRQADDDTRLGPYARLVPDGDRPAVVRAATVLTLADELNRRIAPGASAPISGNWMSKGFELVAPVPGGWRPRGVARRFRTVFGRDLLVVVNDSTPVLAPALEPD